MSPSRHNLRRSSRNKNKPNNANLLRRSSRNKNKHSQPQQQQQQQQQPPPQQPTIARNTGPFDGLLTYCNISEKSIQQLERKVPILGMKLRGVRHIHKNDRHILHQKDCSNVLLQKSSTISNQVAISTVE